MKNKLAKITSIILTFILVTAMFTGCSNSSVNPSNETNDKTYSDYNFWEIENKIRITLPIETLDAEDNGQYNGIGTIDLSNAYLERVETLKSAMIEYFKETYQIDISNKISKQKIKAFTTTESNGSMVMGYVDPSEPDILNLNNELFKKYKDYFDNTYIHESLHQIGFISKDATMITEGIVEALTDLILRKANIKSLPTDDYYEARILAYQILAVDTDMAEFYLSSDNADIVGRINTILKDVTRPFIRLQNVGERLEDLTTGLTQGISGTIDPYYVAFEAQEIVRAYCQTFNPDNDTIDYIRSHYLVEDYEFVTIVADGEGYHFKKVDE